MAAACVLGVGLRLGELRRGGPLGPRRSDWACSASARPGGRLVQAGGSHLAAARWQMRHGSPGDRPAPAACAASRPLDGVELLVRSPAGQPRSWRRPLREPAGLRGKAAAARRPGARGGGLPRPGGLEQGSAGRVLQPPADIAELAQRRGRRLRAASRNAARVPRSRRPDAAVSRSRASCRGVALVLVELGMLGGEVIQPGGQAVQDGGGRSQRLRCQAIPGRLVQLGCGVGLPRRPVFPVLSARASWAAEVRCDCGDAPVVAGGIFLLVPVEVSGRGGQLRVPVPCGGRLCWAARRPPGPDPGRRRAFLLTGGLAAAAAAAAGSSSRPLRASWPLVHQARSAGHGAGWHARASSRWPGRRRCLLSRAVRSVPVAVSSWSNLPLREQDSGPEAVEAQPQQRLDPAVHGPGVVGFLAGVEVLQQVAWRAWCWRGRPGGPASAGRRGRR